MKKILLVTLALIMCFATVISTASIASADTTVKFIDASLNEVELDGDFPVTPGRGLAFAADKITITGACEAPTSEYVFDTALENGYIGVAWSMAEACVYIGIQGAGSVEIVSIEIGGKTGELDASISSSVTGISGALCAKNADDSMIEIAIPLEGLELKNNGKYLYTDFKIAITCMNIEDEFDGAIQFTDYSANFVLNPMHKQISPALGGKATMDNNNKITFNDDTPNSRSSAVVYANGAIQGTKNMVIEFDINVKEMPFAQVFGGGPGMWHLESTEARMWFCVKYRYNDQLYFNIINHVDDGIVLLIQEQANAPQTLGTTYTVPANPQVVPLGKEAGDLFNFKFEWSEDNHGIVSVDGKVIYETDQTKSDSPHVGTGTGYILMNTQTPASFEPGAKVDVEISNISIGNRVDSYSIQALAMLAGSDVDTTVNSGTTGGDNNNNNNNNNNDNDATDTEDDNNDAATTDDTKTDDAATTDDTTSDAEETKGGCGGSVTGMSIAMMAGAALVTATVSSKKRRK